MCVRSGLSPLRIPTLKKHIKAETNLRLVHLCDGRVSVLNAEVERARPHSRCTWILYIFIHTFRSFLEAERRTIPKE